MTSGTTTLAAAVLASARRARATANAAEAQVLADAVAWSHLHQVTDPDEASTVLVEHGHDTGIPIAGDGAPLVSEFAVAEFASALGLSAGAGRNLVGQALELAHPLPKPWGRVQAGAPAPWRGPPGGGQDPAPARGGAGEGGQKVGALAPPPRPGQPP